MLDRLPVEKVHIGGIAGLDRLPSGKPLSSQVRSYLIACKVEGKSPKTLETYFMVLSRFLNSTDSDPLSPDQIRLFLLSLQNDNLKPSTVHIYYRSLNTFFNWLEREGVIEHSPMSNIKPPRVPLTIIKPFTNEDIQSLLLRCSGDKFLDVRNRGIILLFLDTAIRLSELAGIQLNDINFDRETIKIMGKGSKERIVRIGRVTQKALLRYILMRRDNHGCLWLTEERRPMTRAGVEITIKRLTRRAGITGTKHGAHTFRHTAAINYLRNGGGEFTLQIMLGHSTLQMTRRYVSTLGAEDMIKAHRMASPVDNMKL